MKAKIIEYDFSKRCAHNHIKIDDSCNEVVCMDCGKTVDPIWILKRFSMRESSLQHALHDLEIKVKKKQQELNKLKQAVKEEKRR